MINMKNYLNPTRHTIFFIISFNFLLSFANYLLKNLSKKFNNS